MTKKICGTPELTNEVVNWKSSFTMKDGTTDTLGNVAKSYREAIGVDLQRLKLSGLITTTTQNEFIRMQKSNVFVYSHIQYVPASDVTFTNIVRASKQEVTEVCEGVWKCEEGNSHDEDLLPFLLSNPELRIYYKDAITRETPSGQMRVQKYLDSLEYVERMGCYRDGEDKRYFRDHHTYEYAEDIWTRRLSRAMKFRYTNLNIKYTAHYRGSASNSVVLQKMPEGTPLDIFLFHGSPDIMIQCKPISVEQDLITGCIETKLNKKIKLSGIRRSWPVDRICSSDDDSLCIEKVG